MSDTKNKVAKPAHVTKSKAKEEGRVSPFFNGFLWLISILLLIVAIGGNYYYVDQYGSTETTAIRLGRVAIVIAVILLGLATTLFTNKGRALVSFTRESYIELRKVVWPTKQESTQTTAIVFVAVAIVSLFLYLCDIIFLQIVRFITV